MTDNTGSGSTGNPAEGGKANSPAGAPAPAPESWANSITDAELKGWVENKGFHKKGPDAMATSYRELEKLFGADRAGRTIEMPTNTEDQSVMDSFYNKLGRPAEADKYELSVPEGSDPEFAKWAKSTFHKLGLTNAQAKALSENWNEFMGGKAKDYQEKYAASIADETAGLKKEWGAAYENRIRFAKNAAREFGMDEKTVDKLEEALGFGGLMRFMSSVGEKLGEDKFVSGDVPSGGFGPMTPGQAKAKLSDLLNDKEFNARYLSGEATALERVRALQKMIVSGGRAA